MIRRAGILFVLFLFPLVRFRADATDKQFAEKIENRNSMERQRWRDAEKNLYSSSIWSLFWIPRFARNDRNLDASSHSEAEVVSFPSRNLTLHGVIYKPLGSGPFPAVVYNHGSAPGMLSAQAFDALGPVFASHGWVFFGPYRRGQGLSASAGPYIGDEISAATKKGGITAGATTMVRLLETQHLNDQLAALAWLRKQDFVQPRRVAVAGNSFGGIEAVLGAEKAKYCAAIDSAGGAQSWAQAPELQALMTRAVRNSQAPIFFFQAENDYDLSPSRTLSEAMKDAGKVFELKIYPPFGDSVQDGHTFGYFGSSVWADDVLRFLEKHCGK